MVLTLGLSVVDRTVVDRTVIGHTVVDRMRRVRKGVGAITIRCFQLNSHDVHRVIMGSVCADGLNNK